MSAHRPTTHGSTSREPPLPPAPGPWLLIGTLSLLAATATSSLMVLHHFGAMEMPGCGLGSPCDAAAKSVWGKVPGLEWPVSFVGLAYFLAMLIAWPLTKGRTPAGMRAIIALGALASLGFTAVTFLAKLPCIYCLFTHAANLLFVIVAEKARKGQPASRGWQPLLATILFLATSGSLALANNAASDRAKKKADDDLKSSIARMTARPSADPAPQQKPPEPQPTPPINPEPVEPAPPQPVQPTPAPNPLAGRYRAGPEQASVRVVMWMGYQCQDCQRLEAELEALRRDTSLSMSVVVKHFPLCTDCNPNAPGRHHANACWAARAAESAGIMGGNDAFWKMHDWLFSIKGDFSNAQMDAQAAALGFNPRDFSAMMNAPQSLAPVTGDVDDAMKLGIYQTPFVFINGVELRGWNAPQALTRAVRAVAASAPAPSTTDVAPGAAEKLVADWLAMPVLAVPAELRANTIGPADADVDVVVWGDYSEPGSAEVDGIFRLFLTAQKPNIRYTFLQFPVDKSCNPGIQVSKYPQSCRVTRAAKAAEVLAGPDGFWKMHDRAFLNQNNVTDAVIEGVALELGLNPADFFEAMALPTTQDAVNRESAAALRLGAQSIPFVLVNGRLLTRWKAGYENIIPRVIAAAAEEKAAGPSK